MVSSTLAINHITGSGHMLSMASLKKDQTKEERWTSYLKVRHISAIKTEPHDPGLYLKYFKGSSKRSGLEETA